MATPGVSSDTFICGSCQAYFSNLVQFLEHKRGTSCGITYAEGNSATVTVIGNYDTLTKNADGETPDTQMPKVQRKKGRPRKGEEKNKGELARERPSLAKTAITAPDGSMQCELCKGVFKRERHFKSHKCDALGDYVDISKSDTVEELQEGFSSTPAIVRDAERGDDDDETEDYRPDDNEAVDSDPDNTTASLGKDKDKVTYGSSHRKERSQTREAKKTKLGKINRPMGQRRKIIADYPIPQSLDDIPDVPVFKTDEERVLFEEKMDASIDFTQADTMYKTHAIEQTMNENALPLAPRSLSEISLFSCNVCEKVFKSLSHIRLHCLTHSNKKPFKCPECEFRSNAKGNIYSHMRKHTGQFYRCRSCEFKCVNKSHLLEHEATHSDIIHKCALCKKNYSTTKSLVFHIRRFHGDTQEGKEYFAQFIPSKEGPGAALLYECHICDRKFKKPSDRDRHLYVHNVRLEHTVHTCEICQYETVKLAHLHAHFKKHKYIYCCAYCPTKYVSTERLLTHFSDIHTDETGVTPQLIFEQCIEKSFYLPEKQTDRGLPADELPDANPGLSELAWHYKLGFQPLTLDLLNQIKETLGSHECAECGNWFQSAELLLTHQKGHEGEKPFSCTYCDHKTFSRNSLKLHMNANHEDRQFRCDECNFTAKTKISLYEHRQKHEDLQCPLCKIMLQGKKMLRNHLLLKHEDVDAETARRISGYGRRTDCSQSKTFRCPYCERTFLHNNSELQKHIWMHEGIKPYKCGICDHACRTRSNLTMHMLRHTEHKPFPCNYCGKKYKSKTALHWHEKTHTDGKVFKCGKCSYEGMQRSHLKRHMEIHNLLKRYVCNHCDFSANTLGYMRIHYTRFHAGLHYQADPEANTKDMPPPLNTRVYKCVSCDYLFGNLSDMKRHLKMRHRIHMADMRHLPSSQENLTHIVPLDNQNHITSEVQIIQLPAEAGSMQHLVQTLPDMSGDATLLGEGGQEVTAADLQQLVDFATSQVTGAGDLVPSANGQSSVVCRSYQVSTDRDGKPTLTPISRTDLISACSSEHTLGPDSMDTSLDCAQLGADETINVQTVRILGPDNDVQTVQLSGMTE